MIYDNLFHCSYKMGIRSNNFNGLPVLAGIRIVNENYKKFESSINKLGYKYKK